ncbi:MAG: 50S ribosomal protein L4 [Gammaproteobacteria bacterium]|jgi:large subunit ribosomal protein L4|nr:50S ribosomal protein L4 [Gammaproteobacteria bacterium]MDP7153237.1 50S ribosomal protein L4 [Gammaproteobacteria bacterium]MDP7419679.1 50S ribosomal protein L4 [Gammaproteobacteria bacterium]HJP37897.1 50S ribosomal protein L4 [Gammaproteobacteria bacterium]
MKITITGGSGSIEVADSTFAATFNEALIHQVVTAYRAAGRSGSKRQKNRSDARGGGAKPWRQKGTGRARAGTSRSPIWVGGGRAFAARPRDYSQKVNRKMYRAAMRSMLSELIRQDGLMVVDSIQVPTPKTRELVARLAELKLDNVLILVDEYDQNLCLSARNLPGVDVLDLREFNPVSLLRYDRVLATKAAVKGLEEQLS